MTFVQEFVPLSLEDLPALSAEKKADGSRFVQMLCVNTEEGIDLIYSFMNGGVLVNHEIKGVKRGTTVPSITDNFLAAFVFENEAHDLFGVDISNIAIDFEGNFYALAQKEPMTVVSPEQHAAREKAKKLAAAKAAKAQKSESSQTTEKDAERDQKLAGLDPEKAAKVKAAMEAKAAREAARAESAAQTSASAVSETTEKEGE